MRLLVIVSLAVAFAAAQARAYADAPAPIAKQAPAATAPSVNPAPAAVPAAKAAPAAGWYYIPSGWYMLVPAGSSATASAIPAGPKGNFPGPVALPAGIPAAAGTYPVIVIQQAPVVQPSVNAADHSSGWSRDLDGFYNQ